MLNANTTNQFKKDYQKQIKKGKDIDKLEQIMTQIVLEQPLAARHRDHPLSGNWLHYRDCHVEPDWVLIYKIDGADVLFARTGSHSDLF